MIVFGVAGEPAPAAEDVDHPPPVGAIGSTTTPASDSTSTTVEHPATTLLPSGTTSTVLTGSDLLHAPVSAGPSGDPGSAPPEDGETVTLISVVDGDTIVVRSNGEQETVRLIGINSPETGECFATESASALSTLTSSQPSLTLTADATDRDQYGRLLRYLWVGGLSVNQELVRRGAAIARRYAPDTAMATELEQAQDQARSGSLGLWAAEICGPSPDAEMRVVDIRYDAPGDDNQNLNEEWVAIRNEGDSYVDLTRWVLKDESSSHRFSFPQGFGLGPGETVSVHTGCGDDFGTTLYWCVVGSAVWNNDGDTAFLLDPSGNTHHSETYAAPTTTTQTPSTTATSAAADPGNGCHPSYQGECVPIGVDDVDCIGGSGNGPYYVGRVTVIGPDDYGLDGDDDGVGCEG